MSTTEQGDAPGTPAVDADPDVKLGNLVNAAVTAHLKRALPRALEEGVTPLLERFAATLPKPASTAPAAAPQPGDELATKVAGLEAALNKERTARHAERRAALEEKAYGALRGALTGKVRPEAVETAARLLFKADGRVKVADDGTATFKHGDDELDLAGGVAAWLKTPDAALFAPPPAPKARVVPGRAPPPARPPGAPTAAAGQREDPLQKTLRDLGWG
jgi:hypothetical protein